MKDFVVSFNQKKRKAHFKIDKSKYVIPSKLFPLNNPSKIRVFGTEGTAPITENVEVLQNVMEECNFELGRCYRNSEIFYELAKEREIDNIKIYSGWLFPVLYFPVHHVWIVVNKNSIIDGSILKDSFNILYKLVLEIDNPMLLREKYAEKINELLNSDIPKYKKFVFGKVPESLLYVGSPSTAEEAREIFRKLSNFYPNHPAYKDKGMNQSGLSDLQKELHRLDK